MLELANVKFLDVFRFVITVCAPSPIDKALGLVNGRGRYSTPHSVEAPQSMFMKLEIYNYLPVTTPHAKFQGPTMTSVV